MMIPSDYICRNGADDTADLFCFRDFIDDNPDVLGIYDENGCFVAGNSAFMTLFGQEPPLVLSHFPLKNASRVSNVIQTDDVVTIPLYRYSQGLRYDVEKIGHDYADLHITIYPVGNRGNETLFLCAVHDKNDDLHTAEEYKKATRICHDLFDVPDSAVFICNRAGILTFYSPVMDKIPGIPQDNVPGRHFLEFIHEKDRKHMSGKLPKFSIINNPIIF